MSSTEPKRYGIVRDGVNHKGWTVGPLANGPYMLFSDHQRIVSALEAEARKLREACEYVLDDLDDQQFAVHKSNGHLRKRLRAALAGKANPQ